jgi:hypothetical protein
VERGAAPIETAELDKRGGTVKRTKIAVGDERLALEIGGRTVTIVTRRADGDQLARLFEFSASPTWDDSSPMSDVDVVAVVRGLIEEADKNGEQAEVLGVPPAAALSFPDDYRISVSPVEPLSFTLPGAPTGLVFRMDERGDGHLWALGDERVWLGSDGAWWIVHALIDALADPTTTSKWPRFLALGSSLGGYATQASLEFGEWGIGIVWRKLESGVVGDVVAAQELFYERVEGWLSMLRPVLKSLEGRRVHRQRLLPARTAERWARALERWSN